MPKKQAPPENPDESILVNVAKPVGAAAGKMAKPAGAEPVGVAPETREPAKSQKVPKLSKKSKNKLPRREKKALQKSSK
jgi:hypothetical protein